MVVEPQEETSRDGAIRNVATRDINPAKDVRHGSIRSLDWSTAEQLLSSKHITSLNGVVVGLIKNSLDAGSRSIEVRLKPNRGSCEVEDDGEGIDAGAFEPGGGLCSRYHTSKHFETITSASSERECHGRNGMFLTELAALSLLSIQSVRQSSGHESHVTIHHGRPITRQLRTASVSRSQYVDSIYGTKVSVRDLFGNMPVRVKQRAIDLQDRNYRQKCWQYLQHDVVSLLLAWHSPCRVRLYNDAVNKTVTLSSTAPQLSTAVTARNLRSLAGRRAHHDLHDKLVLLSQAGLVECTDQHRWVPLSAKTSDFCLRGLISLDPAPNKHCQFASFGIHPLSRDDDSHDVFQVIDKAFASSNFAHTEVDYVAKTKMHKEIDSSTTLLNHEVEHRPLLASRAIACNRHPAFIVQFSCEAEKRDRRDDQIFLPDKALLPRMSDLLDSSIRAWLEQHNFRARQPDGFRRSLNDSSIVLRSNTISSATLSRTGASGDLKSQLETSRADVSTSRSFASGLKAGRSVRSSHVSTSPAPIQIPYLQLSHPHTSPDAILAAEKAPLVEPEISVVVLPRSDLQLAARSRPQSQLQQNPDPEAVTDASSDDFGNLQDADLMEAFPEEARSKISEAFQTVEGRQQTALWTDPTSNLPYRFDMRTGNAVTGFSRPDVALKSATLRDRPTKSSNTSKACHRRLRNAPPTSSSGILQQWKNPVFEAPTEESIRVLSVDLDHSSRCCNGTLLGSGRSDEQSFLNQQDNSLDAIVTRSSLSQVEIVGQVDQKYILCSTQAEAKCSDEFKGESVSHGTLILVDQHAASERIILESILQDMFCNNSSVGAQTCGISTTSLTKPLHFDISAREIELFAQHAVHFTSWGISYVLPTSRSQSAQSHKDTLRELRRLIINALPLAIAERCSTTPNVCIDMLRRELWDIEDNRKRPVPPRPRANANTWLASLPDMPRGMLELINSRACRSAIMFNDILSHDECAKLMQDLSQCTFPFICAHGRVSMVAVGRLDMTLDDQDSHFLQPERHDHDRPYTTDETVTTMKKWIGEKIW